MTLTDFAKWTNGSFEEYQKLLDQKEKLERQIRSNANRLYDEEDSLEVFDESETNTHAYQKHFAKRAFYASKAELLNEKYEKLCRDILEYQS